jgi:NAD-specific glutamate dehydrogenase/predicted ATPase
MTNICIHGHPSRDPEFCDVCGRPIRAQRADQAVRRQTSDHRGWVAIVTADREFFDQVAPDNAVFPENVRSRTFPLEGREILIGRQSTSRRIAPELDLSGPPEDFGISHKHAWLQRQEDGRFAVVDAGSVNGTTINQSAERIAAHEPVALADGDRIHLGFWTTITVGAPTDDVTGTPTAGGATPVRDVAWLVSASLADPSRIQQRSAERYEAVIERFQDAVAAIRASFDALSLGPVDDSAVLAVASADAASEAAIALLRASRSLMDSFQADAQLRVGIDVRTIERWSAQASPADREAGLSLARAAHGGQVLVSAAASAAGLSAALPPAASLRALGSHRLQNLSQPQLIHQVVYPDFDDEFPPLRVLDNAPNNLPEQGTDFIGRHREVAELADVIRSTRLCSISGPGGVGKTRLALQVAARALETFSDGVWFADLASVTDPSLVASAVIDSLDVREGGAGTVAAPGRAEARPAVRRLVEHLGESDALLILDNCERVLDGCRELVAELLRNCPTLRVLVTTREPLRLVGEAVFKLDPLQLPAQWESPAAVRATDSVALFLNRASVHQPELVIGEDELRLAADICVHLDGVPLAIELAAARTTDLTLAQIAELLTRSEMFPPDRAAAANGLYSTLGAMIEWSYNLLSDRERLLFCRLAVFAGGFELNACRSVCAGGGLERFEIADLLNALVSKSLVEAETGSSSIRFRLLETARRYAADRLVTSDEESPLRDSHLTFFCRLAEQAEAEVSGPDCRRWFQALDTERENLLLAMIRGRETGTGDDQRIAAALGHFWLVRGRLTEGAAWLDDALVRNHQRKDAMRAKALVERAMLAMFAGDFEGASRFATEAEALADLLGVTATKAKALTVQGMAAVAPGDLMQAAQLHERAIDVCATVSDLPLMGLIRANLGNVLTLLGDTGRARDLYDESVRVRREAGDEWGLAWALFRSGSLATWEGRFPEAIDELEDSLDHARRIDFGQGILLAVLGLAEACYVNGDQSEAEARYLEALDVARDLEEPTGACLALAGLANVAIARGDLAKAGIWLTEEEAVAADRTAATLAAVKAGRASLASARRDDRAAEALHREVLSLRRQTGDNRGMTDQLERLALVASRLGDLGRAATMLAAASKRRDEMELPVPPVRKVGIDQLVIRVAESGDDKVHAAWADGLDATFTDVVTFALADAGETTSVRVAPPIALDASDNFSVRFDAWSAELRRSLIDVAGAADGDRLFAAYAKGLPPEYWMTRAPEKAATDIVLVDGTAGGFGIRLERLASEGDGFRRLTLLSGEPVALADVIPLLDNAGQRVLDEHTYLIEPTDGLPVWMYNLRLTCAEIPGGPDDRLADSLFEDLLRQVWAGQVEDDRFNQLVLGACLPWRDVAILRAYGRYLRLIGNAFSHEHIQRTLAKHPRVARLLVGYFRTRFDPQRTDGIDVRSSELASKIAEAIDRVPSLVEDRILRSVHNLIQSTVRTNFFQTIGGNPKETISFKFDPSRITALPLPRPMFEVYVYAPRVEGVHLRGGPIARGGIRWSDRHDDLRTEILGLMKAQIVKNTVIVPTGAKGGFIVRRPPSDHGLLQDEGRACYRAFLSGILDITDNLVDGSVRPPADVVRYDGDDPYLVVAADKGTATFADLANQISADYEFWLGDAFASGGSVGYDHKKLGITAKGAWESAKRHFAGVGLNPERDPLTVVGIGDMSGDVFGNGLQRSASVKLIAAFDHRDIFIDPNPDPAVAFDERLRLYELKGSRWADYRAELLSTGGGVYSRELQSIALSPQARQALGIDGEACTPDEIVRAVLCAPVQLLYHGGIGTYVRSVEETDADVGDKTNDNTRVCGADLRCQVVVEGGNLGFTQRARIEFARNGGLVNTDAIDNSAGVGCSDHEVNIKILLNGLVSSGVLSKPGCEKLLPEMESEVCSLVLRDNFVQAFALARNATTSARFGPMHLRYIQSLEQGGQFVRALEGLPSDKQFAERLSAGQGLTSPELAVMLARTKIALYDELVASAVPDDPTFGQLLVAYFPSAIRDRYQDAITAHPLRREIIATSLTNELVNRQDVSFLFRIQDATESATAEIVKAHEVAVRLLGARDIWATADAMDGASNPENLEVLNLLNTDIERLTRWLLNSAGTPVEVAETSARYGGPLAQLIEAGSALLSDSQAAGYESEVERLTTLGYGAQAGRTLAWCHYVPTPLDLVDVAIACGQPVETIAAVYREVGEALQLSWLQRQVAQLPARSLMDSLTKMSLEDTLEAVHRAALEAVLTETTGGDPADRVEGWMSALGLALRKPLHTATEVREAGRPTAATIGLALNEFRSILPAAGRRAA